MIYCRSVFVCNLDVCCFVIFAVFSNIEEYAPGFKASVVGHDILTPPDLESIFGLTGGVTGELFFVLCVVLSHLVWSVSVNCAQPDKAVRVGSNMNR